MRKEDNDWEIGNSNYSQVDGEFYRDIDINGVGYAVTDSIASLTHAILLLVDAINDKK